MDNHHEAAAAKFLELVRIMARLRSPGGCPWDNEQTHDSLKKYLIEEAYELIDSIDSRDDKALIEECGDVLLQVVFHARIAEEEGRFTILDVLDSICEKLIRRHPHVFGDQTAEDAQDVLRQWEQNKKKEKPERTSILDGVPKSLPPLMQAHQIQERVSRVGFDWREIEEVFMKFEEEWKEFRQARNEEHRQRTEEELGDLFFALVNISRYVDTDPNQALSKTNQKFIRRFRYIEQELQKRNRRLEEATLEEMDALWEEAKRLERKAAGQPEPGKTQ
ncbi:MAG TPA: nucleoside triphosphate pyrophosphohydrolase [bacterium]|nr:nucleoside triphosphate pyrophosphohydrolase [Candidatus Omnitrophota bacterium]HOJ60705.1 nucleoside triphosphate pyrophosphohydrolase [bacterium]HOL94073.1 nucleoside triphosphate pyrophosphohydrolase [bacterium]HPP01416.1 nucleoside triphosphate pyrophosphohydrolase [bacterium]HXK93910.1 nucleoside triphosphate pyrophosphohydrolase [bacterium]